MFGFTLIVSVFILLVVAYIILDAPNISITNFLILVIAIATLVLTLVQGNCIYNTFVNSQKTTEGFVDSAPNQNMIQMINMLSKVQTEEDITEIQNQLVVYTTAFNKKSFNNMGKSWINIAQGAGSNSKTCTQAGQDDKIFTFDLSPVYSRENGMYLGNNRIIGPYSNAVNIQFHNTFSIVIVCKHGNLLVNGKNDELELLKMYANSPNNNGLSFYIQKDSVKTDNNTQVGTLMFQYANLDPYPCKVDKDHNFINLDRDILTFYYIIKDTDNVRILMMTEKSNTIYQILRFNISNTDVTFSNKEMSLNRMVNWNANIYNFAIFKQSIPDEFVTLFYTHIMNEYLKHIDPNFILMMTQYNKAIDMLKALTQCPYDNKVCTACSSITRWNDITEIINAPLDCKKAISEYCSVNTKNSLCTCWDSSSALYKTDACKLYRGIMTNGSSELAQACIKNLTATDLDVVKKQYNLVHVNECPTKIEKPELIKNTYPNYEWEKVKVGQDNKVRSSYPQYEEELAKQKKEDKAKEAELDWQKLRVKNINGSKPNFAINNYYKGDPSIGKILGMAQNEQKDKAPVGSKGVAPPLPTSDSFFNKFMKVVLPQ